MKRLLVIALISMVFANPSFSQKTITSITENCVFKVLENEDVRTIQFINAEGKTQKYSVDEISALLQKDVIKYYKLYNKYSTELQVNEFKKTERYQELYNSMMEDYNIVTKGTGYWMFNMRYNNPYDVKNRCFNIKIGFDDLYRYSASGYLCLKEGVALTYPSTYLSRTQQQSNLATNGVFNYNIVKTTTIPEETALKIEKTLRDPYCSTRLLLVFKLTKGTKEKKSAGYYQLTQNFVVGETIGAYLVNEKTGEVYADMSSIFKK